MTWFGFLYLQKGWPKKRVGLGPSVLPSLLVKSCREFFLVLVAFGFFDLVFNVVCKIFLSRTGQIHRALVLVNSMHAQYAQGY